MRSQCSGLSRSPGCEAACSPVSSFCSELHPMLYWDFPRRQQGSCEGSLHNPEKFHPPLGRAMSGWWSSSGSRFCPLRSRKCVMVTAVPCVSSGPSRSAVLQQHPGLFTVRRVCRRVVFNREMKRRPPNTPLVFRKQYNPPLLQLSAEPGSSKRASLGSRGCSSLREAAPGQVIPGGSKSSARREGQGNASGNPRLWP